jgi:hypothetical protein
MTPQEQRENFACLISECDVLLQETEDQIVENKVLLRLAYAAAVNHLD